MINVVRCGAELGRFPFVTIQVATILKNLAELSSSSHHESSRHVDSSSR